MKLSDELDRPGKRPVDSTVEDTPRKVRQREKLVQKVK